MHFTIYILCITTTTRISYIVEKNNVKETKLNWTGYNNEMRKIKIKVFIKYSFENRILKSWRYIHTYILPTGIIKWYFSKFSLCEYLNCCKRSYYLYNKTTTWRYHILHNMCQIRWIEEDRCIVVDVQYRDSHLSSVTARCFTNFRRAILTADGQVIPGLAFKIKILRYPDHTAVLRDREISIVVPHYNAVSHSAVRSLVPIHRGYLKWES